MAFPATRALIDHEACPAHGPAPLASASSTDVLTNGSPQTRGQDVFVCGGAPCKVTTGACMVLVNQQYAARTTEKTAHAGLLLLGSTDVEIGGPSGTAQIPDGQKICEAMAAGRHPPPGNPIPGGTTKQTYNNCILESSRQIIRQATGNQVDQEQMLDQAMAKKQCGVGATRFASGGGDGTTAINVLKDYGVEAERSPPGGPQSIDAIQKAVEDGRGTIAFIDPSFTWPGNIKPHQRHAVQVLGVEYDEQGNVAYVIIADTGIGVCGQRIPAAQFQKALAPEAAGLVVTKKRVW